MKITWLGQAGLLFETENASVIVDPYLSDSCGKSNPASHRRVPVDEKFLKMHPISCFSRTCISTTTTPKPPRSILR